MLILINKGTQEKKTCHVRLVEHFIEITQKWPHSLHHRADVSLNAFSQLLHTL